MTGGRRVLPVVAVALSSLLLFACSADPGSAGKSHIDSGPVPELPLSRGFSTAEGSLAIVPMGRASDENTFWQVLAERAGTSRVVLVTPRGVADNGGLAAAVSGTTVVVGVLVSQLLGFSPTATSSDGARRWAPGALSGPLAPVPSSMALTGGQVVAVLGRTGTRISEGSLNGGTSSTVATLASARDECGLREFTAVGVGESSRVFAGGSCSTPGEVGLLALSSGRTQPIRLRLPATEAAFRATVAGISSRAGATTIELVLTHGSTESISSATERSGVWQFGPVLTVPTGERLVAFVTGPSGTPAVLWGRGPLMQPTQERLVALDGPTISGAAAAVPSGTESVIVSGRHELAIGSNGSVFTVSELAHNSWSAVQRTTIPIQYGSSS